MKTKYLIVATIAFLVSMQKYANAQEKNESALIPIPSFTGEVIKWHSNLDYIYYAFDFKVGDTVYVVEFPTTLGSKIRSLGNNVTIYGFITDVTHV
jgi:hypothetical protein